MKLLKPRALWRKISTKFTPISLPPSQVNEILNQYDLGNLQKISAPGAGKRSQTVIIHTNKGTFALKAYNSRLNEQAILFEHSVIQFLKLTHYPTPELIENRLSQTITSTADRCYACYEFVAGQRYSDYFLSGKTGEQALIQSAQALAQYHQLIKGFVPKGRKTDGFQPGTCQRWQGNDWYLNELALIYTVLFYNKLTQAPAIMDQWITIQSEFVDLQDRLEGSDPPPLPTLAIHGDFGLHNLLFHRNKLTAVLDFECTHLDWRLADIVSAMMRFCKGRQNNLNRKLATIFLNAYQVVWPLEPAEIEMAVPVFKLARYRNIIRYLAKFRLNDDMAWLHAAEVSLAQVNSPIPVIIAEVFGDLVHSNGR